MSTAQLGKHKICYNYGSDSDLEPDSGDSDDLIFGPCSSLTCQFNTDALIETCEDCGRFYAKCCYHRNGVCHHSRIVLTDGACTNNWAYGSVSGIGIAFGWSAGEPETGEDYQFSIPVDDKLDPQERRTNQRAELLAAIHGLKKICEQDNEYLTEIKNGVCYPDLDAPEIIITTDSEYVVKGMTEWLPRWRENGFRKSNGERPSNLDLFLTLEATIDWCQNRYGCWVGFWRVDRQFNSIADELAKRAARIAATSDAFGQPTSRYLWN